MGHTTAEKKKQSRKQQNVLSAQRSRARRAAELASLLQFAKTVMLHSTHTQGGFNAFIPTNALDLQNLKTCTKMIGGTRTAPDIILPCVDQFTMCGSEVEVKHPNV
jgi:hypothetical protein